MKALREYACSLARSAPGCNVIVNSHLGIMPQKRKSMGIDRSETCLTLL